MNHDIDGIALALVMMTLLLIITLLAQVLEWLLDVRRRRRMMRPRPAVPVEPDLDDKRNKARAWMDSRGIDRVIGRNG